LGANTVGSNIFTLTNPGAITFLKVDAANAASLESAATHRTSLGATTVGGNFFTLANPGAITFPKIDAANVVTAESAATHRTSIGATTVGGNLFTLTNPSAITFLKVAADNSVTAESAATHLTSLGGTTVGQSFFTLANPGAITFPEISATNVVSTKTAAQMRTDLTLVIGTDVQAFDTDLTTWAGITPGTGVGTFLATPSSANLRSALTDENGTGVALFNGATTPDFTTGFTIGTAAGSGKIAQGDGTKFAASAATWPTNVTAGYDVQANGTNYVAYPDGLSAASTSQQTWAATEAYLAGSTITVAAGDWKVQGTYHCSFDVTKTSVAGTAAPVIKVYMGTLGTTGDTLIATLTFPAQTAVADNGVFDVYGTFRSVGSGTSAVLQTRGSLTHNLSITGLSVGVSPIALATSAGFNSTTPTKIGISATFGTSFVGTTQLVSASLAQP
jgi:hypothetical protein